MDGKRFDTLTRFFTASGSRRRVLALALSGALAPLLGLGETAAHDALKKCKKKSGKQKKACIKKAKAHNATHTAVPPGGQPPVCTPNCAGRNCGDDGCGGSCGPCTGGACTGGTCVCPNETEECGGTCVTLCPAGATARHPTTCGCCSRGGMPCDISDPTPSCCTGTCPVGGPTSGVCEDRREGQFCEFDGQCRDSICMNGRCRCPSGKEPCQGFCQDPCPPGRMRNPETCGCCISNGSSCAGASSVPCCARFNSTSTQCVNDICVGRDDDQSCEFDEQCASRFGCINGKCGSENA